jgi:hypothetical protein
MLVRFIRKSEKYEKDSSANNYEPASHFQCLFSLQVRTPDDSGDLVDMIEIAVCICYMLLTEKSALDICAKSGCDIPQ